MVLRYIQVAAIALFGYLLSFMFSGVKFSKKSLVIIGPFSLFFSCLMATSALISNATLGWRILPLSGHLPNLLFLLLYYKKRFSTALAAVCTSFLLCQPPSMIFNLASGILPDMVVVQVVVFVVILAVVFLFALAMSKTISAIFNKDDRSVYIFASIPIVYYISNYFLETYTKFWTTSSPLVTELFRFALCMGYMLFCVIYFKEYEEKKDLAYKEQIIQISLEQQTKEIEMLHRTEKEIRILRHDMRLFANILRLCIQTNDMESAAKLANNISNRIDNTDIHRYCAYNIINYILSDYAVQCANQKTELKATVKLEDLKTDEIMFASVISNALDNALRANRDVAEGKRSIDFVLKSMDGKIYLSVRNPVVCKPTMVDGLPVSDREGHGYGSQSILYVTEKLGGNCMFSATDEEFLVRVII